MFVCLFLQGGGEQQGKEHARQQSRLKVTLTNLKDPSLECSITRAIQVSEKQEAFFSK